VLSNYGFNTTSPATYDNADRLTGWNRTDGNKDQSWNLSLVGDWTSFTDESVTETRAHSNVHELTAITGGPNAGSLGYDVKGNLTSNTNSHTYSWDFDNKMSGADTDSNPGDDITFDYDALGRRVRKNNGTTSTVYVLADQQVVAEYLSGTVPASPVQTYTYGSYIDEPILKKNSVADCYYHRNQQYSVTAVTDPTGATIERYAYGPYGNITILDGPGSAILTGSLQNNEYTYTGRRFNINTDLYYFRARYFEPSQGRFVGRDPVRYVDGLNLYACYFALSEMDPTGRQKHIGFGKCQVWLRCENDFLWADHCGIAFKYSTHGSITYIDGLGFSKSNCNDVKIQSPNYYESHPNPGRKYWPTVVDKKVCDCLLKQARKWNKLPCPGERDRTNLCRNSNWTAKCLTKSCGLNYGDGPLWAVGWSCTTSIVIEWQSTCSGLTGNLSIQTRRVKKRKECPTF